MDNFFCFLDAKQQQGICEIRCDALQSLLHVRDEGSIICEENVPDQPLLGLGVSLEAPWIEEAAIQTVPVIHPIFVIQIVSYLLEHHAEEDSEESQ